MHRICIQWPRFGPLQLARLRATHELLRSEGIELIGVETAADDSLYEWRVETGAEPFSRVQVFPGAIFEDLTPREMHRRTLEVLDDLSPDAVGIMSYGFPDGRAALEWCRRRRRTAVLMTTSKADDGPRIGWREWLKRQVVAQYDSALVAGTPQQAYLEQLGFESETIFHGYATVDNAYFRREADLIRQNPDGVAHLPGLGDPSPFFLASNRFLPFKNLDRLIMAYRDYRREVDDPWRLLLLGDGPEHAALAQLVEVESIGGVVFSGFRQIDELPAYYALAGAFIHPTLKDTWGLVVNEAMATGLPVLVSTKAGCAQDLVVEGVTGFSFDPLDPGELTELMMRVSAPDFAREEMGARAMEHVAAFDSDAFSRGFLAAVRAGQPRASRGLGLAAHILFLGIRLGTRHARSFHSTNI